MPQFIPPPPNPSIAGSHPPSPTIPVAPPPWTLRAKAWTFLYSDVDKNNTSSPSNSQNPNNNPSTLQSVLPDGAYHPSALEKLPSGASQFNGKSWLKAIMIVRYEDTDVGPYDELILLPGRAVNPYSGSKEMRISTIYVSTDASVWNGRRNWNIPKHRAIFSFRPIPNSKTKDTELRVYHPEDSPAPLDPNMPFFTALLKGSSLPKLPLPSMAPLPIVQPPLLKSRWPAGSRDATIGTDDPEHGRENPWLLIRPSFTGRWGVAYVDALQGEEGEAMLEYHGDGVGFPEVKLWSVGAVFEGTVGFGIADVVS